MSGRFLVLIADDDANDRMLIEMAIKRDKVPTETREVHDGEQVIEYLRGEGNYSDRIVYPFPDLLLLDLKMPRMDGLAVLEWVRNHPEYAFLPTIMLSGSGLEIDVQEAHKRGGKAYFTKPADFRELEELVRVVAEHWSKAQRPGMSEDCSRSQSPLSE